MKQEISKEERFVIRFLLGQLTGKELDMFRIWLEADEGHRTLFSAFQEIWCTEQVHHELTDAVEKKDWGRLRLRIQAARKPVVKLNSGSSQGFKRWLKVAAVFFVGFVLSRLLVSVFSVGEDTSMVYNEISTPLGAKSKVKLPDGSVIVLNAGSKLRYPQSFDKNKREVFLEGEAFFNVSHDVKRKFFVNTPEVIVKVYGTKFNVKAYPSDKTVETTLVEGEVRVVSKLYQDGQRNRKEIVLQPNQRLVLYKQSKIENNVTADAASTGKGKIAKSNQTPKLIVSKHVNPEYYTSWKDGRLIIRSERLEHLAVKLERRFDVRIQFKNDKVKAYRFTGTIEKETVEQVLEAIKTASKISYKIDKRNIWIGD